MVLRLLLQLLLPLLQQMLLQKQNACNFAASTRWRRYREGPAAELRGFCFRIAAAVLLLLLLLLLMAL